MIKPLINDCWLVPNSTKSSITWLVIDNVDCLLVAKMLTQAIRSKDEKSIFMAEFVNNY